MALGSVLWEVFWRHGETTPGFEEGASGCLWVRRAKMAERQARVLSVVINGNRDYQELTYDVVARGQADTSIFRITLRL